MPRAHHQIARMLSPQALRESLSGLDRQIAEAIAPIPPHATFLRSYCPAA